MSVTDWGHKLPDDWRLPAEQFEQLANELVRTKLHRPVAGAVILRDASVAEMEASSYRLLSLHAAKESLGLVERINLKPGELRVHLNSADLVRLFGCPEDRINNDQLVLCAPFRMRRRGVELKMHLGKASPENDRTLVSNSVKAQRWTAMTLDGKSFSGIALTEGTSRRPVQDVVDLAMLAPNV
ncbi:MAG: hypothetical protein QNJ20_08910 [Paracoccaceae bacterium]|nr:hypothetical protein [Paracoccaceae bacterium]